MSVERITRAEIIRAIKDYVARTGKLPSLPQLQKATRHPSLNAGTIHRRFGNYANAIAAAGYKNRGSGRPATLRQLFLDWATLVRRLQRIPTIGEYGLEAEYSIRPLIRRCGGWRAVPVRMLEFANKEGLARDWQDVVRIIRRHLGHAPSKPAKSVKDELMSNRALSTARSIRASLRSKSNTAAAAAAAPRKFPRAKWSRNPDEPPTYGVSLSLTPLVFAPCNEDGVLFLFGAVAGRLGFSVLRIQPGFPDCEAMREVSPGRLRRARIEFEFESLNFLRHGHPIKGADIIVCWRHNWDNCPLEVIELRKVLDEWKEKAGGRTTL